MMQIFVGLIVEGTTDQRFLKPIVEKALNRIAYDCQGQVDIDVQIIECDRGSRFTDYVCNAAQKGHQEYGITLLIVHCDADNHSANDAYQNKIIPAKTALDEQSNNSHCKNMAALVPIYETEAWMLADKPLLIKQIGTSKNEVELNIHGNPETFNNPKERIEEAIRIGMAGMPKKLKKSLSISDLYDYLGGAINIENLVPFISYQDFEENIRQEFIRLNFLQT